MTRDTNGTDQPLVPDDQEAPERLPRSSYEPPVLVPLGNVHALLAAGGPSPHPDAQKGANRQGA